MKVLYLTKYSRNGASSRLRSFQYFPFLEANGFVVTVKPFFDEAYLINLYSKTHTPKFKILTFYFKRFCVLFSVYKYDRVVIEKELFPYFFSWFEKIFYRLNIKYIVDYDDAIFHNYDLSTNKIVSYLLKNKIDTVMKYSQCVIAGNSYLAQRAQKAGAKQIKIIPTVIDSSNYKTKINFDSQKVVIGWIGSPTTFKYVKRIKPVLSRLFQKETVELHIIGAFDDLDTSSNCKYFQWSEENEVQMIARFDIGIMPLENTPWEKGKCAYKLIQYMGCGIPVVASSVGMNVEVVEDGVNGFLVETEEQWFTRLSQLIESADLRKSLGKNGRSKVESEFCIQSKQIELVKILKNE